MFVAEGALTIEDNGGGGVMMSGGRFNSLDGGLVVRDNLYGIIAQQDSSLALAGAHIESNTLFGVRLSASSVLQMGRSTIQSNNELGVSVSSLSVAFFGGGNTITGNGGLDVFCTPDSLGQGSKDGIGKMICPTFNAAPTPGPASIR
jgi:hypothetical protein